MRSAAASACAMIGRREAAAGIEARLRKAKEQLVSVIGMTDHAGQGVDPVE